MSGVKHLVLSHRYKLRPTKAQHRALERILEDQRQLYNAALEERIEYYKKTGKTRTFFQQCRALTECRADLPEMAGIARRIQVTTLKRLDDAYARFFARIGRGDPPGFPRFKGRGWFNSFGVHPARDVRISGKRLRFKGLPGSLRIHIHRPLPDGKIVSCSFCRKAGSWWVTFDARVVTITARTTARAVGVDVGLQSFATLSNGATFVNRRPEGRFARRVRVAQRALSRCKRNSARRRKVRAKLARLYERTRNARHTNLHQISAELVRGYDLIAIEALRVSKLASGPLARPVLDAAWSTFARFLRYKTTMTGVRLVEVDPTDTSQICPECGMSAKKPLHMRVHVCVCGCYLSRDVAAARVILKRAVVGPQWPNVTSYGVRATKTLDSASLVAVESLPTGRGGLPQVSSTRINIRVRSACP